MTRKSLMLTIALACAVTYASGATESMPDMAQSSAGYPTVTIYVYQARVCPVHTHTWVVFQNGRERVTISWMPNQGGRGSKPGTNWTHQESLAQAHKAGAKVQRWGPYLCQPSLFARAKVKAREFQSGKLPYAVLDAIHRRSYNCVHAAASPAGELRGRPLLYGYASGPVLVRHFQPYLVKQ